MTMKNSLIEIQDLHVYFQIYEGLLKVLNGVDFTVKKGEKVGLIGETGCGKTTTMKAIMRILPMLSTRIPKGKILFDGKDILEMKQKEIQQVRRRNISMVFQDPTAALNPVFKVGDQLMDIIKYSNIDETGESLSDEEIEAQAIQVLKEVALPDPERMLENYPIQLSGGMRQRACMAMALVSARDLLIADEPGTNLDVTIQDQILRLLSELVEAKGTSVILISHALGAVRGLVDRVYVGYAGSMIEVSKTDDLFADPLHPYANGLLRAVPKLTGGGIPEGIGGRIPDYLNPPKGCRFFPRCDKAMQICKENKPPFFDVGDAHEVACYLYQE
ncbi:MAG: ABC transporter ATP-binding protein [Candidatus Heimdallarchaeota archaeon]